MADFSFSFDSDNPFAEPEQTPKKASAPLDEVPAETPAANAGEAAPTVAPAVSADGADDAFSLDVFDFAFDEDSSINDTLPTRKVSFDEASPRQLTPGEAAFAEFDFSAPDTGEAPVAETSEAQAPEIEISEVEVSAPKLAAPEIEMPEFETPEVETPETAPEIEMPDFAAPQSEVPVAETLDVEAPEFMAPEVEISETEVPEMEASETVTPETVALETEDVVDVQDSGRSARSDLEEFNAFTYDFDLPEDETFESGTDAEVLAGTDAAEFVSDEITSDVSATEAPIAEFPMQEVALEEFSVEEPAVEEPAVARRIATNNASEDAPLLASVEETADEGQTEGEFRRLKTKATLKVAVLGASGIGKNHARWFHRHGCQVVGFLGTSPDSTTQTETDLSADFDFQGNAYTDLEVLLQSETPDIVCVATPPPLHFGHVLQSLEAGAHVLCEKPLVYAPTRKFRENRDGAKELVKVAAKRKLNLGTQLQYGGATPILCKLAGLTPTDVGDFAMELETTNPNAPRDPRELWVDLGPHPVSVAQMLAGTDGQLAEDSIVFEPYQDEEKTEVLARFGINCADGRLLMVRAVVRALRGENPRKPRRRFSFNGHAVTYAPLQSAKNGFQAQFVAPDGYASVYPDPVDYLIGNFVSACRNDHAPMITGDFGRENLEWMLKVAMPGEAR